MARKKSGEHSLGDIVQLLLLVVFLVVWGADSFVYHWSTFLSSSVPLSIRLALMVLIEVFAVSLIRAGHPVAHGSGAPKKLVTAGAFRVVRHPLYLGCLLFYCGLLVATFSLLSLPVFGAIFIFYNFIASYEEKFLEERFKDEFSSYKKKTGKWLPRRQERGI